jgi:hypothetical protein
MNESGSYLRHDPIDGNVHVLWQQLVGKRLGHGHYSLARGPRDINA